MLPSHNIYFYWLQIGDLSILLEKHLILELKGHQLLVLCVLKTQFSVFSLKSFALSIVGLVSEQESKMSKTRKPDSQR